MLFGPENSRQPLKQSDSKRKPTCFARVLFVLHAVHAYHKVYGTVHLNLIGSFDSVWFGSPHSIEKQSISEPDWLGNVLALIDSSSSDIFNQSPSLPISGLSGCICTSLLVGCLGETFCRDIRVRGRILHLLIYCI